MNIKKISAAVMAAAVLAVSLTACSDGKESNYSKPANNSTKKNNNTNSIVNEIKSEITNGGTPSTPMENPANSQPGTPVYTDDPSIVYSPAEDFEYWYDEAAGGTMIRGYIGAGGEVAIPKEIDGKPVTVIDQNTFKDNATITSIYIPSTVKKIDKCAFQNCKSLETVTLVNGLEEIGHSAFLDCGKLRNIEIPDTVTKLSLVIFSDCTSLETVVIGKGISEITRYCFNSCSSLKSITIPGNVKRINHSAFSDCTSLETVILEDGVEYIGEREFLSSDYRPSIAPFKGCSSLINLTLPESLEVIYDYAFSDCTSLTDVEVPSNCEITGAKVFSGCKNIKAKFRGKTYTYDQLSDLNN